MSDSTVKSKRASRKAFSLGERRSEESTNEWIERHFVKLAERDIPMQSEIATAIEIAAGVDPVVAETLMRRWVSWSIKKEQGLL